jgi:hypothetical protein
METVVRNVDWKLLYEKLESLRQLQDGWNQDGAPAPSARAIDQALIFVQAVEKDGLVPARLAASVVGGVGATFRKAKRKAYVEFYNDGAVCSLFSDGASEPIVSGVGGGADSFAQLISSIRAHLDG